MEILMKTLLMSIGVLLVCGMGTASRADVWGLERGTPELSSASTLAFGPDDILLIGDAKAASIVALATGDRHGDAGSASINIDNVADAVATATGATKVMINDLTVNPSTGSVFIAVTANEKPAIVKIDAAGKIDAVALTDVRFATAELSDAPEDRVVGQGRRARNRRKDSITDIAYFEGKILVSGLRSADAPSSVRELNFPFAKSDKGVSVEIFHAAHGRDEDYAAMRTFVPLMIDGEPNILGAYICTPLVRIPVSEITEAGKRVKATTVAELGNRNQPLDMISYEKDGKEFLLLSNSARGVMKITTAGLSDNDGLTDPVRGGGVAGQSYETVKAMQGVVQMDKLNDSTAVLLLQNDAGTLSLKTVALP
jgi:hypothetical protein